MAVSELFSEDYVLHQSDRKYCIVNVSRVGGMLVATKSTLESQRMCLFVLDNNIPLRNVFYPYFVHFFP